MNNDLQIELIRKAYTAFNAREADAVLELMLENVRWPNGWEGGHLQGKPNVKEYWLRQWGEIDPRVDPIGFKTDADGRLHVDVHQTVYDRAGALLADSTLQHVYRFEGGLIAGMEIQTAE